VYKNYILFFLTFSAFRVMRFWSSQIRSWFKICWSPSGLSV